MSGGWNDGYGRIGDKQRLVYVPVEIPVFDWKPEFVLPTTLYQVNQMVKPRQRWQTGEDGVSVRVRLAPTHTPEEVAGMRAAVLAGLRAKMVERYSQPNSKTPNLDRQCEMGCHQTVPHGYDGTQCTHCGYTDY